MGALAAALCMATADGRYAQALSRTYLCLNYTFESAELPLRCPQILAEFVDFWREMRDGRVYPFIPNPPAPMPAREMRVEVTGYSSAERDGNNLAFLRAARVARELATLGIPGHLITINAYANRPVDFSDLRSGQNRHVDIVYR